MSRPDYTGTSISSSLDAYSVLIFWKILVVLTGQGRSGQHHHTTRVRGSISFLLLLLLLLLLMFFLRGRRWGGCD
jgi:hypothetical protein